MPRSVSAAVHWILGAAGFACWFAALQLVWNEADALWSSVACAGVGYLAFAVVQDLCLERKRGRQEGRPRRSFVEMAGRPVGLPRERRDARTLNRFAQETLFNGMLLVILSGLSGHRDFRLLPLAVLFLALYAVGKAFVGDGGDRNGSPRRNRPAFRA